MNNKKCYGPFQLWVLNNFPFTIDDWDSITQYQMLCKCLGSLKEQLDINSDLYKKISDLENYLANLDLQDEVNNKIDEMVESGQLQEIITEYLQINGVLGYDTVSNMVSATNLIDGSICRTLGLNIYNDGKGEYYKIRTITSEDVVDGINIIALNNYPTLIAELIPNYDITNIKNNITSINNTLLNKVNKYIPKFIVEDEDYYIRIGTKEHDNHYLQFSTDLINWHTICDLPSNIFMQPTSYKNSYDCSCFIYNNEFYILYDYVDEDYNDWRDLDNTKFLFGNRIGVTKTSDFKTWTKYALNTPLEYKQLANPRILIDNNELYLCLVGNDGTLISDESAYYHFPLICKLNETITSTSDYTKLINSSDNIIDPFIYKENNDYYLFVSLESPRSVKVYKGSSLTTQFTNVVDTIDYYWNLSNPVVIEGASLIKKDNLYYLIMDSVDHYNVINVTSNIENWNNCTFVNTDSVMGNAQICEIKTEEEKSLMKKFYEVNDYPIFNKFPMIKKFYDYFNQTKKTFTLYAIPNKRYTAYTGIWDITVDKSLMLTDNDTCVIVNAAGSSNNVKLSNLHGNNTVWYLPVMENVSITNSIILANGNNRYIRLGHEAVSNVVANTVKKIDLSIPNVTYGKVKSVQLTPFTSGTNTKHVYCYVDTVTTDKITCSILSNENISAMELYWIVYIDS